MIDHLKNLLTLTGPVLVLISFFTTQRAGELRALSASNKTKKPDFRREAIIASALPVPTTALLAVYAGAAYDVLRTVFGKGDANSLGYAFLTICLLVIALIAVQVWDACRAWKKYGEAP
jgi:hypothetical protein